MAHILGSQCLKYTIWCHHQIPVFRGKTSPTSDLRFSRNTISRNNIEKKGPVKWLLQSKLYLIKKSTCLSKKHKSQKVQLPFQIYITDSSGHGQYTIDTWNARFTNKASSWFDSGLFILSIWMMISCQFLCINFSQWSACKMSRMTQLSQQDFNWNLFGILIFHSQAHDEYEFDNEEILETTNERGFLDIGNSENILDLRHHG